MTKILLISTGGTIACSRTEDGLKPSLDPGSMLEYVGKSNNDCLIDTFKLLNIDSTNVQPEHWIEMVETVRDNYEKYDSFIITHGTDTAAYTASALSYLIQNISKPVIITGAQKPISDEITDARKNLRDSILTACEKIHGVFLVFNGKVILGTRCKKVKTESYDAFESINYPFIASVNEKRITYYVQPDRNDNITPVFYTALDSDIFLLKLAPGMKPEVLDYISDHYDGIVIESYGSGGIPFEDRRNFLKTLKSVYSKNKIIVISTQVMLEGSDLEVYEVGKKVLENPVLQSYDMTLEASITKLMWIMGQTKDYGEIRKMFYTPVNRDIITV